VSFTETAASASGIDAARAAAIRVGAGAAPLVGTPLWIREYPSARVDGVGWVLAGANRGGSYRVGVAVGAARAVRVASLLVAAEVDGARAVLPLELDSDAALERAVSFVGGNPALRDEGAPLGLLDVAFVLLDVLRSTLGAPARPFDLGVLGVVGVPGLAPVVLELRAADEPRALQVESGASEIEIRVVDRSATTPPTRLPVRTPEDLFGALPQLVDSLR
jgi:hypothetical protein